MDGTTMIISSDPQFARSFHSHPLPQSSVIAGHFSLLLLPERTPSAWTPLPLPCYRSPACNHPISNDKQFQWHRPSKQPHRASEQQRRNMRGHTALGNVPIVNRTHLQPCRLPIHTMIPPSPSPHHPAPAHEPNTQIGSSCCLQIDSPQPTSVQHPADSILDD